MTEKMNPDMSNAFSYTEEQLAELAEANAKRWAVHREWFDEYDEPAWCRRCGANVSVTNFDLHIQWHQRGLVEVANPDDYPSVIDITPECVCGCRQGAHLFREPKPCVYHADCYRYTPAHDPLGHE